jgi:type I restriction enzyme R subunit
MPQQEAKARIKINKMLEESGWRFDDNSEGKANILLENYANPKDLGDDFEHARGGFIDYLLLDKDGSPLIVLEAKRESINPLSSKDQARNYARNKKARFIILSNGESHFLWDTDGGSPETISRFPTQESISQYKEYRSNPEEFTKIKIDENFIIESQKPDFQFDPEFINHNTRPNYLKKYFLKQLRPYQVEAVKTLQEAASRGQQRFLFEMATGTGKTLVSAAVIKLFLKSGNAKRVLFLVDRLELEDQADKAFKKYLKNSYLSQIYKKNKNNWRSAQIVVTTVQSLLKNDRFKKDFSPTDFELVISDEAHRSINGDARAVFEYFVGYKLGLTATPKNYLKGFDDSNPNLQREFEKRMLRDTYKTFGSENGIPTFSYDLVSGATDGYLVMPHVLDVRTEITTQLLSDEGLSIHKILESGDEIEGVFSDKDFEKKIFNEKTNLAMCILLLQKGLRDPIGLQNKKDLFGKTIVFCVSQNHAAKVTNILNNLAQKLWPNDYKESDFAKQISSQVLDAQQMTINFANNNLGGKSEHIDGYETSKTRIAVTVGMMTTGYDCEDLLNLALMRPIFSPSEFVQIKGRGTRKFTFEFENEDRELISEEKNNYYLFDFFATCEYFDKEFDYDQVLRIPGRVTGGINTEPPIDIQEPEPNPNPTPIGPIDIDEEDTVVNVTTRIVDNEGMLIDRQSFRKFTEEKIASDEELRKLWEEEQYEAAETYLQKNIFEKPIEYLNLEKVKKIFKLDRRITANEFLAYTFGEKDKFETKQEILDNEWQKFLEVYNVPFEKQKIAKELFKAYISDSNTRNIIDSNNFADLNFNPAINFNDFVFLGELNKTIPRYIRDYRYNLTNL